MEAIVIFWLACGLLAGLIYGIRTKRLGGVVAGVATVILLGPIGIVLAVTEPAGDKAPSS